MIFNFKIKELNEEELEVLMHILTDHFKDRFEFEFQYIKFLKVKSLFELLNLYAQKCKPEGIPILQSISDKLININN